MRAWVVLGLLLPVLAACGGGGSLEPPGGGVYKLGKPYQINGRWYHPRYDPQYRAQGLASWYGPGFHGRPTANGERFDMHRLSAAHPTLPLPSLVEVENLKTGKRLVVRVNDRGPFVDDRLIDLSYAAARHLGFDRDGLAPVRVTFLRLAPDATGTPPSPTVPARPPRRVLASTAAPACAVGQVIQVGAFREPARARAIAQALGGYVTPTAPRAGELARVRVGPVRSPAQTKALLRRLWSTGHGDAFVLPGAAAAAC